MLSAYECVWRMDRLALVFGVVKRRDEMGTAEPQMRNEGAGLPENIRE